MAEEVKTYSRMRRDFFEKYKNNIIPTVSKFEEERKKKLASTILQVTLCAIGGILLLLDAYFSFKAGRISAGASDNLVEKGFIIISACCPIWFINKKNFENKIKSKIMPIVCSCFENLEWFNKSYSNGELFVKSGIVSNYTSDYYDDIFRGSHKNVWFEIVEAKYYVGSGKSRRTVFDGVVVRMETNKYFKSHTIIAPDFFIHSSPIKGLMHTVLEDVEFEKKFDVYTNDEVEARYLITPSFMERLKAMKIAFKANKIQCAFYGKELIVALSTNKDLFSLCSLVKPMDLSQQYFQMYEEIVSIVKLIDHFKLDQKIGL